MHARSVPSLWSHVTLQPGNLEPSQLQSSRNEVEETRKLAKDQTLDAVVLRLELAELLDERLDLCRRAPLARVDALEHALPRLRDLCVGLGVEVNRERDVAYGALGDLLNRRLEVLTDALAAEDVLALAHDGVLALVEADPARRERDGITRCCIAQERLGRFALEHHVRVAGRLCSSDGRH